MMKNINLLLLVTSVAVSLGTFSAKAMESCEEANSSLQVKQKWTFNDGCKIKSLGKDRKIRIKESGERLEYDETDKPAFKNDHGETVFEYSGNATDKNTNRSWAKAIFLPKGYSDPHHHKERTEDYYITASETGKARIVVNGVNYDLSTGDHIRIHPHDVHTVINLSETNSLELLVKCVPSWIFQDVYFEKSK